MTYEESDALGLNMLEVKNINKALQLMPCLDPPNLVPIDILHNVLLKVFDHMMDEINEFL